MNTLVIIITLTLIILLLLVYAIGVSLCLRDSFKTIDNLYEEIMSERKRNINQ